MKIVKHKKGQFIIFATLIIAIMIISIGTVMYSTVTYFKHERWQEYLMMIDNVELGSQRVVEISLTNYTSTFNNTQILVNNLNQWQTNLTKAYPGFGVALTYSNATIENDIRPINSTTTDTMYFSSANATFNIDITSVGLTGYKFVASAFLGVILNATYDGSNLVINISVEKEDSTPVTNLDKDSFFINNTKLDDLTNSTLTHFYEMDNDVLRIIYRIVILNEPEPSNVLVAVVDARNISVIANSTVT
ncbi:MAG: hypothetical protein JSV12_09340 [Candidatus Bathyarchaeota archaeon]|nr:MAG: hypothetical protein JSV12_09340 [Candidatus Bathyarchaeota archaeon]